MTDILFSGYTYELTEAQRIANLNATYEQAQKDTAAALADWRKVENIIGYDRANEYREYYERCVAFEKYIQSKVAPIYEAEEYEREEQYRQEKASRDFYDQVKETQASDRAAMRSL